MLCNLEALETESTFGNYVGRQLQSRVIRPIVVPPAGSIVDSICGVTIGLLEDYEARAANSELYNISLIPYTRA